MIDPPSQLPQLLLSWDLLSQQDLAVKLHRLIQYFPVALQPIFDPELLAKLVSIVDHLVLGCEPALL